MAHTPAIASVYDEYFRTGLYSARYPRPNAGMVRIIRSILPERGAVLDFGCGNGRYIPFLIDHPLVRTTGYDISHEAIAACQRTFRPAIAAGRLDLVGGSLDDLAAAIGPGTQDLVLLLFGVLGHIRGRAERIATLRMLRSLLRPGGRMMVTVPNRRRRFHAEQRHCAPLVRQGELEAGDVLYSRKADSISLDLFYHLFTLEEFLDEMREAGLVTRTLFPESILSERASTVVPGGAALDTVLRQVWPLRHAYGFGAVAERPLGA